MNREYQFDFTEVCDICGKVGAFDIMGDYLCSECLQEETEEVDDLEDEIFGEE